MFPCRLVMIGTIAVVTVIPSRMRILISAYACSPYQGSEPGVGWGFVLALAKHHDVWVIVEEEKFRQDIEKWRRDHPEQERPIHFHFVRKRRNRILRKIWPPSYYYYYRKWHKDALALARILHAEVGFDLAHQLTMVGFREPGYLWKLGVPFVWGPVGGMGVFPWRFLHKIGPLGALYYLGYNAFNLAQQRWLRRPRLAAKIAGSGLICATRENAAGALHRWGCSSHLICEVGLPNYPVTAPKPRVADEPLRIVWTGLHIPRKALNLGIEALAKLPASAKWELHVLGDGPRKQAWIRDARRLGIFDRCRFHGWIPRNEALSVMAQAHLMLITSLRDLTSTVTVEALAQGLPIICLDHCGFGDVVNENCGIKVPVTSPSATVCGLADAVRRVAEDEMLRQHLARGAIQRAQEFAWEKKIDALSEIYAERVAQRVGDL
jgi:glycosyltransferase involved in cell wall biosynthesis